MRTQSSYFGLALVGLFFPTLQSGVFLRWKPWVKTGLNPYTNCPVGKNLYLKQDFRKVYSTVLHSTKKVF